MGEAFIYLSIRKIKISVVGKLSLYFRSILQGMNGCGDSAAAIDERLAGLVLHRHNRCMTEKSAKLRILANRLAHNGNNSDGGGLVVYNANRDLIGNDARNCSRGGVTWNCNHI